MNQDDQPYLTLIRFFVTPADSLNYSTPTNEPDSNFPCFGLLFGLYILFIYLGINADSLCGTLFILSLGPLFHKGTSFHGTLVPQIFSSHDRPKNRWRQVRKLKQSNI